jgi:hypothetical protein
MDRGRPRPIQRLLAPASARAAVLAPAAAAHPPELAEMALSATKSHAEGIYA